VRDGRQTGRAPSWVGGVRWRGGWAVAVRLWLGAVAAGGSTVFF